MKEISEQLMEKMPLAFSLHEVVRNSQGLPVDYRLVKTNPSFVAKLGLSEVEIVGKKMSEWLFKSPEIPEPWLNYFAELVETSGRREFADILTFNDRWYLLTAFVPYSGYLVVLLHETARFKKAQTDLEQMQSAFQVSLETSQAFSRSIFDNNPSSIIIYEVKGKGHSSNDYIIRGVNPTGLRVEGWNEIDVVGQPLGVMRPGVDEFGIIDIFRQVWETGQTAHYPAKVYKEGEEYRWFENIVFKLPTGEIVAIYADVTENKLAEEALFAEKEKLQVTLYSIGDAVISTDVQGRVEILNPVAENLTGWTQEEATGQPLNAVFEIYNETTGEPCKNPVEMVLQTGNIVGLANHTVLRAKDGTVRHITDSAAPIRSSQGDTLGVILVFRDVTEAKEREAKIEFLSFKDPLTGLYNRAFFEAEFERMDAESYYPLTLIMGDLDGLKLINDAFGHKTGDRALAEIADIIRSCCRKTDLIFRWGGDEFLILLPSTTSEDAQKICDRIKELASATKVADTELRISLGCASKTHQGEEREKVLREAENNMYKTKLLGAKSYRNVVLSSIKKTLFEKSDETEEHGKRMGRYCREIGETLGLSSLQLDELEVFSMLHDIGKIGIDEHILQKPGKLTPEEWTIMRTHPEIGYRIAHTVPELANIADYILAHHERWDGKGYPKGLVGKEIPLLSRILSVVDAYDAMTQDRSYRKALAVSEAKEELRRHAGTQFDPQIVDVFLTYLENEVQVG